MLQRFTVEKINGLCELSNFIMCPSQTLSLMFDRIMIKYFKIKMLTSVEIVVDLVKVGLML